MGIHHPAIFLILQMEGLLPVSLETLPLRGDVLRYSTARVLYSVLLLCIICGIFCGWIWHSFFTESAWNSGFWSGLYTTTAVVSAVCSTIATAVAATVCLLVALFRTQKKINLLESLRELDFQLQKKNRGPQVHAVSCLALLCASVLFIGEFIAREISYSSFFQLFKVLIVCGLVEWLELVLAVKDRLQTVNHKLEELVNRSCSMQLLWTVGQLPCIETFTMPQETTMTVSTLSDVHWSLCCLTYDMSAIYGPQLVAAMVFIFSNLVFHPYQLFLICTYVPFPRNAIVMTHVSFWILLLGLELFMLVTPCSLTVSEAKKTVAVGSKLMGSQMGRPLFKELESFVHQLMHRDVEFTACGLFTLRTSIVISVATAVTTYLAITIQFQTSTTESSTTPSLLTTKSV